MGKRQARLRVGVLEPDDDLRQLLLELFQDEGFDVCVAKEWEGLPSSCCPDVIVTDPDLPYERERVAQHLELLQDLSGSQILLLSDRIGAVDDIGGFDGAVVVTKPFEVDELLSLLPSLTRPRPSATRGGCARDARR